MFRVSCCETIAGQRWTLCGRLAGAGVDELRKLWRAAREQAPPAPAVVDLSDVIFIDNAGEAVLAEMQSAGAQFVAAGVENKHLVACLKNKEERALRRGVEDLSARCGEPVAARGGDK